MRLSRAAAALCIATILSSLAACERLAKLEAMPQRVSDIEGLSEVTKTEVAVMRGQLMTHQSRITALEQAQSRSKPESQAPSEERASALGKAITDCVKTVRISAPGNSAEFESRFWTGFDAYYNPASGKVENNVIYNGERPALYAFNKCMTAKGIPLTR